MLFRQVQEVPVDAATHETWPDWRACGLPGGQFGAELAIQVVGDTHYGDKVKGVIGTIANVIDVARQVNPQVRLKILAASEAGDLLMSILTLPAWKQLFQASSPGNLLLEQVDKHLLARPDLMLVFWDPRYRRPDLLKLAHEAVASGITVRCHAFTGLRTVGPVELPSMRSNWNGGRDGCPLSCLGIGYTV
ncbi:hypothetical protein D3C86_1539250 [compost metagenome]